MTRCSDVQMGVLEVCMFYTNEVLNVMLNEQLIGQRFKDSVRYSIYI